MARVEHRWAFSLIWINVAVTVVVPVIQMAGGHGLVWGELLKTWIYSLAYANGTGIPAIWLGPLFIQRLQSLKLPLAPAVMAATIVFAAVGCLLVQALLMWAGITVPQHFWQQYLRTLQMAMLLAIVFGMGAFFYGSQRERLRLTELLLREKEVAEARTQKLAAEARLRSLESRIHPHFLFNTLNSISSLIASDPARAEQVVGRLAALLRASLDTATQPLIPLREELAMVEDYVDIERVRFGDKLQGRVEVPEELRDARVPPLSIQSLVENAVKHGITPQKGGGQFVVAASAKDGALQITVSDSGPGFDLTAVEPGHGLDNLVGRLDALFAERAQLRVFQLDGWCVVEMVLPRS